jgi:hypothetical protein
MTSPLGGEAGINQVVFPPGRGAPPNGSRATLTASIKREVTFEWQSMQ